jgi:hypothetical protein
MLIHGLCLVAAVMLVLGATPAVATTAPSYTARHCDTHSPATAADVQAVADSRNANFGIGDMTATVRLPDGRRFFTLGDTAYYDVAPDGHAGHWRGFGNNSAWVQSGSCFRLLDRAAPGTRSWLIPPERDGSVYWPGAAVVAGSRVYVFLTRLFLDRPFGRPVGAAVAVLDLPSLQLAAIHPIPFSPHRIYGIGAVYDNGYLYAYASQRGTCDLCFAGSMYVARVREDRAGITGAWQFRSGASWVRDANAATPVLSAAVSTTDVQRYGNGFLLVTKPMSIVAPDVEAWWSPNPEGPWRDLGSVFTVPVPPPSYVAGFTYQKSYTYNPIVLADEPLRDGGYLMSYNVNTFDPGEAARDGRMAGPRFVSVRLPAPPSAPSRASTPPGPSPWAPTFGVDRRGRVGTLNGGVRSRRVRTKNAVAVVRTPTARGGWVASASGAVFAFGDARFYGSLGAVHLNQPIVGMAATPTGAGYWLVASDGGVFAFGDARYFGSTGNIRLHRPIVGIAPTPTGSGYWLVASDGGIFTFGDARFYGSTGGAPPAFPVRGIAPTPDGLGYWLVTLDGRVFAFGDAPFAGNAPRPDRRRGPAFTVGVVAAPGGYRIVESDGAVYVRGVTGAHLRVGGAAPLVAAG